jgi:hypothetical protein
MERFCGSLQPAIRSRRYPYASLNRFITESSQLKQIAHLYNAADVLALRPPLDPTVRGGFSHPQCTSLAFLPAGMSTMTRIYQILPAFYYPLDPMIGQRTT